MQFSGAALAFVPASGGSDNRAVVAAVVGEQVLGAHVLAVEEDELAVAQDRLPELFFALSSVLQQLRELS